MREDIRGCGLVRSFVCLSVLVMVNVGEKLLMYTAYILISIESVKEGVTSAYKGSGFSQ